MIRIAIVACLLGTAAASKWTDYLGSLKGKSVHDFDWQEACKSLGQQPASYGMSSGGGKATFNLGCDSNKIKVICETSDMKCSSDYVPPATAASTPPTGEYNKKVTSRAKSSCQGFSDKQVQDFLNIHNKMRCAVGVPPLKWDGDLECQAQKTQDEIGAFEHSKSYDKEISAGENLATGKSVANAAWMWFTEYLQSGGDYVNPAETIGHYSAMSWKSVKRIGCGIGTKGKGVIRCQYAADSRADAPNMAGKYAENLTPFKGTKAEYDKCGLTVDEVKAKATMYKKWGILSPSGTLANNIGMYSLTDTIGWNASPFLFFAACAGVASVAMLTIGLAMRRRQHSSFVALATDDERELCVESGEGLE